MDGVFLTDYIKRPYSLDEHRHTATQPTPIQRVHRKPVTSNPKLTQDIIQPAPPIPRSSMSSTTFWNPRTERQTTPLEPLKRGLSKKLRGLLLPRRTFIEKSQVKAHDEERLLSLQRCTSPQTFQKIPFSHRESRQPWDDKDFLQIDNYVSTVQQRGPLLTPVLLSQKFLVRPYRKDLFRLRALFIWIVQNIRPSYLKTTHGTWMKELEEEEAQLWSEIDPQESAEAVLEHRMCRSSFGMAHLFVTMAQAAGFSDAKVIYGYLKGPRDVDVPKKLPLNHAWCVVKIEEEYRMVDCWLASPFHPQNKGVASHWFLCTATEMVLTHFPQHPQQQYLNVPLSAQEFFELPYLRHAFFLYPMRILKYQTEIRERGVCYVSFQLKERDVHCYAETEAEDGTVLRGLAQCMVDEHDKSIFKVKGVLPPHQTTGWLKVYLGPRSDQQQQQQTVYPLAMCISIKQEKPIEEEEVFEFVKMHVDHDEFYINEPQCYVLYPLQTYRFNIKANRLDYYYNRSTHYKLAIKSPSGKLSKLMYYPQDQAYDGQVTLSEVGKWSLVCLLHNTGSSYTVASWTCKL